MDLASFFAETAAAIERAKARETLAFPTFDEGCGNDQVTANKGISHVSCISHAPKAKDAVFDRDPPRAVRAVVGSDAREDPMSGLWETWEI
jgi:hypothetical protein